ncbi:MAG: VOC family protein [Candidatus Delongbacteria bacterium]|nr:VOC family protein [Candidatus Cloacimonadota bacterium]MCB9472699.1 VOC family protein [Candidatus Delongbacteria bacterium]
MTLHPGHIELFCTDPARTLEFFTGILGAELISEQEGGLYWVDLGGLEFLLRPGTPALHPSYGACSQALVLYTDNLPATRELLERRGLVFAGEDGHPDCPTFHDPDGHWFQLVDPGDFD